VAAAVISGHGLLISLICAGLIIVAFGFYDPGMAPDPVDVFVGVLPCFGWAAIGFDLAPENESRSNVSI